MKLIPREHQVEYSALAYEILARSNIVYLAMEERTGKTITAILTCEKTTAKSILVITKKKALGGWIDTFNRLSHKKNYDVVNYHQAHKVKPGQHDIVVLDESHNYISSFPKRSGLWKVVKALTKGIPLIYISATPHAQGRQLLYNQLALSDWSPFKRWTSPYSWFRAFGIPEVIYLSGRAVETYKQVKDDEVKQYCDRLFLTATRKELGFKQEPLDNVHWVELQPSVREAYNLLMKHRVIELNGVDLICDTSMKLRTSLHMLEGGVAKIATQYMVLGNTEKIKFIKEKWGDTDEVVIMYQYIAEGVKLRQAFSCAEILQGTSFAEGIDLSHKKHLIIYSQDFSTAKHTQRRARQANMNREHPIHVHFLLVKKAISEQVYTTVSVNKQNFVDSVFTAEDI